MSWLVVFLAMSCGWSLEATVIEGGVVGGAGAHV